MLFQIDYSVFKSKRRDALTAFGTFTQEQLESLLDDHGVELIGRSHCLGEGTGTMIVETDDFSKCSAFQLAWADVCDMRAKPVMTDIPAREAIKANFS